MLVALTLSGCGTSEANETLDDARTQALLGNDAVLINPESGETTIAPTPKEAQTPTKRARR
jgi:hypothetical protein